MFVSVIVLAAGESRRMGRPKPLLDFDGESCLSLVLAACRGSRAAETVLVVGAGAEDARQKPGGEGPGAPTVAVNTRPERGQTSSLKAGLDAMSGRSDGFMVLPVDQPLVGSGDLDALIARLEAHPRGRTIFVATHEGRRGHPVLFSSSHRAPVLELSDDEPLSGYVRIREAEVEAVPVDNAGVVMEMNTPEQYEKALALYRDRRSGGRAGEVT